jgi:hypothetical protein
MYKNKKHTFSHNDGVKETSLKRWLTSLMFPNSSCGMYEKILTRISAGSLSKPSSIIGSKALKFVHIDADEKRAISLLRMRTYAKPERFFHAPLKTEGNR